LQLKIKLTMPIPQRETDLLPYAIAALRTCCCLPQLLPYALAA